MQADQKGILLSVRIKHVIESIMALIKKQAALCKICAILKLYMPWIFALSLP
ncbi:MAG: hypothetical protein FWE97_00570 [Dehalococcoidia bacterium]|nr:hypothetical protein [Dehalococcoidia bacterium]